jgi:hypothetical protein
LGEGNGGFAGFDDSDDESIGEFESAGREVAAEGGSRKPITGINSASKPDPFSFIDGSIVEFGEAELVRFSQLAEFVAGNPRKMKRVVNSYMVSRALSLQEEGAASFSEFREKLIRWTIMCVIY